MQPIQREHFQFCSPMRCCWSKVTLKQFLRNLKTTLVLIVFLLQYYRYSEQLRSACDLKNTVNNKSQAASRGQRCFTDYRPPQLILSFPLLVKYVLIVFLKVLCFVFLFSAIPLCPLYIQSQMDHKTFPNHRYLWKLFIGLESYPKPLPQ